jgi:hypothetical protein
MIDFKILNAFESQFLACLLCLNFRFDRIIREFQIKQLNGIFLPSLNKLIVSIFRDNSVNEKNLQGGGDIEIRNNLNRMGNLVDLLKKIIFSIKECALFLSQIFASCSMEFLSISYLIWFSFKIWCKIYK